MKGNIFINKYVMACAISIVIALVGFIAITTLPIEQYPNIAPPTVRVSTSYTGADANTIMKSVVQPLEESINGVPDMTYITSSASASGDVSIQVYFKQGTDPDLAAVNVQNRVSKATALLPAEVTKVGVQVMKQQNNILHIGALKSTDGKYDADFISNYIDINIKPRLMRITGVGDVMSLGNTYALRIWLKPDVMAQYGMEPNDVFAAIGGQSFVAATGSLGERSENAYQYSMEYKGTLKSVEEFNDIVLRTSDGGHLLHLSDVADVEIGAVSYNFTSNIDGKPGTLFMVFQAPGANATEVNARIHQLYEDLKPTMPAGLEFEILQTSDDFLFAAIHNVVETLVIAIILVILVVYFFLQSFKATVIPSISIIVSLLGTFAIVQLAGFSLNILTLFALVLAIGTVVDDAIVVVEAVMAKMEGGISDAREATRQAMSEVSVAVISCTLVFMAVFIPVAFMPGTSGSFFLQFGVTLASAVGLSCVSALTLCPALCGLMMRFDPNENNKKSLNYYVKRAYTVSYNAISDKYKRGVSSFIKRPWVSWLLLVVAAVLLVFAMRGLPSGLVPQEDQGVFFAEVRAPEGCTLHETEEIVRKVEEKIKNIPELESYAVVNGYGMMSNSSASSYATLIVRLKNWDDRPGMNHIIELVYTRFALDCQEIKNAVVIPFQMPQVPGYGSSNSVNLVLQDTQDRPMSEFNADATKFIAKLNERPEIMMAMSTYSERFPKYEVNVDAAQCDRAGVTPAAVLNTLGSYCGGAYVGNFNQFGKVYRIMANAAPEYRLDPSSLHNIFVRVRGGKMAPISEFVTLKEIVGSASVEHFNLFQSITCGVMCASGYSEGDAHNAIREVFKETMPAGYTYEYGGMSREVEETAGSNATALIYLVCAILIYLILASLYNSWFTPFAVLLSVPFGLMGSFGVTYLVSLLHLPGMENNIYLQTGVIMLIGLLAKTAILITEFASERRAQGMSIRDAAFAACEERLRPILMTVVTMIAGMIPLIIAGGAGANGNRVLALGVTAGMAVGTLALLFVVPAFFIVFQTLHEKFQGNAPIEAAPIEAEPAAPKPRKAKAKLPVIVLIAMSTVLMSSCGIYGKYHSQTEVDKNLYGTTEEVTAAQADSSIAAISWREFFADPLLQQLIDSALSRNTDLNSARIAIEQSQASLKASKLGYLPSFTLAPQAGYSGNISSSSWVPVYNVPLQMSWDIDLFGTNVNQVRKSKAIVQQAEYRQKAVQANLISTVAQQYYTLQLLDRELEILLYTDSLWNISLETQRALFENGKAYSTSVNQMENSYLNVKTQIVDVRRRIRSTENAICQLLAITPQTIERSAWSSYELPESVSTGVPAQLLENRPDIRIADQALAEAFYNTNAARSAFFPKISLQGVLGWGNNSGVIANPGALLFNALASLTQPIFAQGRLIAQLRISKLAQADMQQKYVQTVINAGNEVNEALADCQAAKEKDSYYKRQVEVLQDASAGTRELMDAGKANYLEVLTAQETLLSAQLNEAINLYEGSRALIALYIALGGGAE
ncbi:MAG: efflux RND transporter permease subunit [Paludibacteraceae bacterium]|nr:efflux RND transporter permease subunit [Paludibacteraceae bacterium]